MGVPLSLVFDSGKDIPVRWQQSKKTWKPFPCQSSGGPGDLVLEFSAVPSQFGKPKDDSLPFWWVDCQFLPFDDTQLIVNAGAYILRPNRTWIACRGIRPGTLTCWSLDKDTPACEVFQGAQTSARPQVQIHPDGKYLGFVDRGCVRVVDTQNNDRYAIDDSTRPVSHKYCTFSSDGASIAVLFRVQRQFELEISTLDIRARLVSQVVCHHLCPAFQGTTSYTEQVECKFSPDSQLIALSHSAGILVTATKRNLSLHCQVFPGLVQDVFLSNERCYDFDPTSGHLVLAAGGSDGHLYICDIESCQTLYSELLHETEAVDCIKYSPCGGQLAIALSDFTIRLFSPQKRQTVLILNTCEKCPGLVEQPCTGRFPEVVRMSFDKSGQHIAVSSTDGKVRLWKSTTEIHLKKLCKLQIEQYCGVKDIRKLPLPSSLISYLLYPNS